MWLLDLAFIAGIVFTGHELRQRIQVANQREEALLRQMVPKVPAPVVAALQPVQPSQAAQYVEVAQQMLFVRERNPNVVIEPPPPPPPPPPMPALPVTYGVVNLGQGPTVIMAVKAGAPHRGYRAGEKIGAFKIQALNLQEIIFEWDGKYVKKRIEELADKKATAVPPPEGPPVSVAQQAPQTTMLGASGPKPTGPSAVDTGNQSRACQPGDTTPAGTIQDGLRKVVAKTPFGESCRWEPVK
ncbi:MAG TPA: hypothetical protein VEQ63_04400 [Bryobacteraceae bacterium]|nr:hypothetical protein [Bryobacteraceae bacterium]